MATSLGIGRLARHGCLVRDPAALEALARARLLAFDKTGTLTSGKRACRRHRDAMAPATDEVLRARRRAGTPFRARLGPRHRRGGRGARTRAGRDPRRSRRARPRHPRQRRRRSRWPPAAARLMRELGWPLAPALAERARSREASGHSVIYVGWGERVHAVLSLDDTPLPEARATIEALRGRGLRVDAADRRSPGGGAADRRRGRDRDGDIEAGLSPEAKRAALERRRHEHGMVAMVGDGLNDGPVLAAADVGIAVGSATDLARETAAVVLPPGGLWMLPWVDRRRPRGSHDHPHQPDVGVRLQSRRADLAAARTSPAGPGGGGDGRLEPPRGGEFAAARAAARSRCADRGAAVRRTAIDTRRHGVGVASMRERGDRAELRLPSAEHVVGERGVPAFRLARSPGGGSRRFPPPC